MIIRHSKVSSLIWSSEDQIFLNIEITPSAAALDAGKVNEKSTNFSMFFKEYFLYRKIFNIQSTFYRDLMLIVSIFLFLQHLHNLHT